MEKGIPRRGIRHAPVVLDPIIKGVDATSFAAAVLRGSFSSAQNKGAQSKLPEQNPCRMKVGLRLGA